MKRKIRVAILFGGKSAEHEVSVKSAKNVADAMDKTKYDVSLIGIDRAGHWLPPQKSAALLGATSVPSSETGIALAPGENGEIMGADDLRGQRIDVVFPILHGPFGEDGTVQGLLRLANVPFVGAGVLGSAVGMDKHVMKRLLRDAGIPIGKFLVSTEASPIPFARAKEELGLPMFIKPANLGSSVGISKVTDEATYDLAIKEAFEFDTKVIIEEFIKGREIECSVLGNDNPIASVPGEVLVHSEFYSYEAKYLDENGASLQIPADLPADTVKLVQETAVRTFNALCCEGMGRVDSFLTEDGRVIVNEINTIPGFTNISMYPKMWEASGISYSQLIDKLIELAIERFEWQQKLKTSK
ncbi:D-alanine--D-alanine ligase A [Candidatus Kaiserbacteria bacterium RIFCSPHIGHO2_02_FULL_55_25]|uniref:D-alanine--D-alanine ligase n=1 Tax=Candidatus Kaiserbacteria bacterium RIFCSPHIGHO2_02_FULL_55_25 TaxID=1798498 RepID=A0A1F6E867_9BACT|nr:MAG: D-alanine--D-alanine ligase A [Candidatus Kaiserbacteria bacterium RIFCSPHIGHO2_01_FULL_55_79]OGG69740.1 MAG: D-alanine--D-alanine ligase A [Candidatus Kaiserbacteria bacterium RIFCSPHIGHO2_02_FULL_55_25]OGG77549.1 MAG: D-alanine--D-alanine ligase A [Candidatus Kaiserbacteria bacterium RIFCSPHIGHO2_12_FULL_55_13]OGG83184.1 MAG: D-alanine--D-alanine ligase A [Candidatus Kaiserbacteria bacterium RIFCSPLOWO2_01_FULL_55_25]